MPIKVARKTAIRLTHKESPTIINKSLSVDVNSETASKKEFILYYKNKETHKHKKKQNLAYLGDHLLMPAEDITRNRLRDKSEL